MTLPILRLGTVKDVTRWTLLAYTALAAFAPEKFSERDRFWEQGDAGYYGLSDALQHLGSVAFRQPVPAYHHSAALFLYLLGRIPSSLSHPKNATRPPWEREMLRDCARRLGYEVAA